MHSMVGGAGGEGVELRLVQSSPELVLVIPEALFLVRAVLVLLGCRSWAELPGGRAKCWQEEQVEVNAGREGCV